MNIIAVALSTWIRLRHPLLGALIQRHLL